MQEFNGKVAMGCVGALRQAIVSTVEKFQMLTETLMGRRAICQPSAQESYMYDCHVAHCYLGEIISSFFVTVSCVCILVPVSFTYTFFCPRFCIFVYLFLLASVSLHPYPCFSILVPVSTLLYPCVLYPLLNASFGILASVFSFL